jgi:ABC-type nickel/cobalt efflux system permease component RcnA
VIARALAAALVLAAAGAWAHPLGNFTTNRLARLEVGRDRVTVRYVVDVAELPTFRIVSEIDTNGNGTADAPELAAWAARLAADVARTLHVDVDGTPLVLATTSTTGSTLEGAGGLPTLRAELGFEAPLAIARGTLAVRDDGFAGLPGWQEIVAVASDGTTLSGSTASASDRTDGLRRYPTDVLAAPPAMREARLGFAPGTSAAAASADVAAFKTGAERFGDRLTALVTDRRPLGPGTIASALLVAAILGAFHALTPGHGKTIVGAYLVGSRGTWRHAVFLGLVVTATHTLGVYALGAATLVASAWILPERLLPWLSAASGLLVVSVGTSLLIQRLETAMHGHAHAHHHHGPGGHTHDDGHDHGHTHEPPADMAPTLRNLLALGVSGGMLPCPSALVVMLGAIAIGRTAFGLVLILAFSVGLAVVLTAIGLVLVYARGFFDHLPLDGRLARFMPVASAAVISLAGIAIVIEALVRIGVTS